MVVSILALVFLIIVAFVAFVGYKAVIVRGSAAAKEEREKCSICLERFPKADLLMRQVGDYKLLYFCRACVLRLYSDLGLKN
jgi:hypothetical protein